MVIEASSILDNDLYKFSMGNVVTRLFPNINVRYQFINRGKHQFPPRFSETLRLDIQHFSDLALRSEEKNFLKRKCPYLDPAYLDFLEGYRYDSSEVSIVQDKSTGDLKIEIEGPWYRTIYWEVPLMALISEQYYISTGIYESVLSQVQLEKKVQEKRARIKALGVTVSDFGTRRRFSFANHKMVVSLLKDTLVGTSNVYLAMLNNLKPIGTQAHEMFMAMAALYGYRVANRITMEKWIEVFRGNLGIALSDTFTTDVFLKSFDTKFAKLFDGIRQDSGDPIELANKIINHYKILGIDPMTKTIVFSDSLDLDRVHEIHDFCSFDYDTSKPKIRDAYGIGTNLTNDVGVKPLNFVIKLSAVQDGNAGDWIPAVKLSDSPGKHTGLPEEVELCKRMLRIQ